MNSEFFMEIYSEEIPARMQTRAVEEGKALFHRLTCNHFPNFDSQNIACFISPMRLVVVARDLPYQTAASTEEYRGPKTTAPDQAVNGFIGKFGYDTSQLTEREGYWYIRKETKATKASVVLEDIVQSFLKDFSWPKSMRWASARQTWARPIRRVAVVWNGEPLTFFLPSLNLHTNNNSTERATVLGHRFLAPQAFEVKTFEDYKRKLKAACVIIDQNLRKKEIQDSLTEEALKMGLSVQKDPSLLDEVTGLVEFPVVLIGHFPQEFMKLPDVVLSTSMRVHQKYFSLLNPRGKIAPSFAVVANRHGEDNGMAMIKGYERVLSARLRDAMFFYENDLKHPLQERVPKLKGVVFHAKLGTMLQKTERLQGLMTTDLGKRAAFLCKADQLTEMVFEFPELQGIMGRIYALAQHEPLEVADAIREHYQPLGPTDDVPTKEVSMDLALADKIDSLVGFFAIGMVPTGSKDPFALRRAALGVIRIIRENDMDTFDLRAYLKKGCDLYKPTLPDINTDKTTQAVFDFIIDRLKVVMRSEGIRHDCIDAVMDVGEANIWSMARRAQALNTFISNPDGAALLKGYRRASHIVDVEEKKSKESFTGQSIDATLLTSGPEKELSLKITNIEVPLFDDLKHHNYHEAMDKLADLHEPIDAFFEEITVNVSDTGLRTNRLNLLAGVRNLMSKVADFSKLEG